MALKVEITKKLPGFTLDLAFASESQALGFLGASGCGKSLTLKCLAGLIKPDEGRIELDGELLYDKAAKKNIAARDRRAGLVFQNYALFPNMTVIQNISIGVKESRGNDSSSHLMELLENMHLIGLENRYPAQLSGGQQQRVALARALAIKPRYLLLDEPFSALDPFLREQTLKWIEESLQGFDGRIVFVSHNIEEAYRLCDQLLVMKQGSIDCMGSKESLTVMPPTLEAAAICGCRNISRILGLGPNRVRAVDWDLELRLGDDGSEPPPLPGPSGGQEEYIGILAQSLRLANSEAPAHNTFCAWISDASPSLHHVNAYLKIGTAPAGVSDYHLEWRLSHDEWLRLQAMPQPVQIQMRPENLFHLK